MDEYHKQILRRARPILVQNLADIEAVCDNLIAYNILSDSMVEEIMSNKTTASKTRRLLSLLVMRGPKAFDSFHQCLIDTTNQMLADIIKPPIDTVVHQDPRPPPLLQRRSSSPTISSEFNFFPPVRPRLIRSNSDTEDLTKISLTQQRHVDDSEKAEYSEYYRLHPGTSMAVNEQISSAVQVSGEGSYNLQESEGVNDNQGDVTGDSSLGSHLLCGSMDVGPSLGNNSKDDSTLPSAISQPTDSWMDVRADMTNVQEELNVAHAQQGRREDKVFVPSDEQEEKSSIDLDSSSWATEHMARPLWGMNVQEVSILPKQCMKDIANDQVYMYQPSQYNPRFGSVGRRRVVIINNSLFSDKSGLPPRPLSNVDATSLDLLFRKLGYETKTYSNLSCERIDKAMETERSRDYELYETFILIIMSHGEQNIVYGTEGESISLREIVSRYDEENCPTLAGKPKLFFVLASKNRGVEEPVGANLPSESAVQEYESLSTEELGTDDLGKVTTKSDMFIAMATTASEARFRGMTFGSEFIQAFVHIIKENCYKDDLATLMGKINALVGKSDAAIPLVQYTSRLRKKFYFFPNSSSGASLSQTY